MTMRQRPARTGRRAIVIAVILSLLLPGLGHAYANLLTRALIWFGGVVVITLVLSRGEDDTVLALSMGIALAVFAAIDVGLIMRAAARPGDRSP
ncbi:MAG: hypothetical protein AB7V42_16370 [Thermoleophilia bacterium]